MKLYIYYETINTHNSDGTEHYLARAYVPSGYFRARRVKSFAVKRRLPHSTTIRHYPRLPLIVRRNFFLLSCRGRTTELSPMFISSFTYKNRPVLKRS